MNAMLQSVISTSSTAQTFFPASLFCSRSTRKWVLSRNSSVDAQKIIQAIIHSTTSSVQLSSKVIGVNRMMTRANRMTAMAIQQPMTMNFKTEATIVSSLCNISLRLLYSNAGRVNENAGTYAQSSRTIRIPTTYGMTSFERSMSDTFVILETA